ncbi:MAG: POTRA domain-containing protein, partial [Polyangiales bacterium]
MAARVRLTQAWLCALLGGVALWASVLGTRVRAEIPEALRGQPIVGVRIGGDEAQLVGSDVTGVQTGDKLDRELVRRAVQKLLRSGRWVDVQVEAQPGAKGVSLVFHLEPRINLRRVEVRGQDRLDAQVVRDALGVSAGSEVRVDALPSLEAAVRRAYAERGYLSTRAAVRFRDTDNPAQKVLLVEIDEGGPVRIAALRTSGDQLAEHSGLFATMGLAAGDVLNRRTLGAALVVGERHLRSQYYLEARLSSPVIAIHNDAAVLTFP